MQCFSCSFYILFLFCLFWHGLEAFTSSAHSLRIKDIYPHQSLFYDNASIVAIAEPVDSMIEVLIEKVGGYKRNVQMKNKDTLFIKEEGTFFLSFQASLDGILSEEYVKKEIHIISSSSSSSESFDLLNDQLSYIKRRVLENTTTDYDMKNFSSSSSSSSSSLNVSIDFFRVRGVGQLVTGRLLTLHSDPSKHFSILTPKGGCESKSTLTRPSETGKVHNCSITFNAGFFDTSTGACYGNTVSNGQQQSSSDLHNVHFGLTSHPSSKTSQLLTGYFDSDSLDQLEIEEMVGGLYWLVRNGSAAYLDTSISQDDDSIQTNGEQFITIKSARSAIGYNTKGEIQVAQIDGKSYEKGVGLHTFAAVLEELGFESAINLDGGGSVSTSLLNTMNDEGILLNTLSGSNVIALGSLSNDECEKESDGTNVAFTCEKPVASVLCFHEDPEAINNNDPSHDDDDTHTTTATVPTKDDDTTTSIIDNNTNTTDDDVWDDDVSHHIKEDDLLNSQDATIRLLKFTAFVLGVALFFSMIYCLRNVYTIHQLKQETHHARQLDSFRSSSSSSSLQQVEMRERTNRHSSNQLSSSVSPFSSSSSSSTKPMPIHSKPSDQDNKMASRPTSRSSTKTTSSKRKGKKTLSNILQQFKLSEGEEGDLDLFYQESAGPSSYSNHHQRQQQEEDTRGYLPSHLERDDEDEEQMLLYNEQEKEKRKKKKKKKKKRELLLSSSRGSEYEHIPGEEV